MTVTYRPTQDQDPQEPGSQHNAGAGTGAGPYDGEDQPTCATPRLSEPIRRKVVVKPPSTPPSGTSFSGQESHGQNPSASNQKQALEQLPTGALPNHAPLTSNRAQTIEQLRAAALSAPPSPSGVPVPDVSGSNWQPGGEQTRRPITPAPSAPAVSNWQQRIEQAPGASPAGSTSATKTREPGMLRNAPGAGYMAYTASPSETSQQGQGQGQGQRPKPEVENGNIILYRTH